MCVKRLRKTKIILPQDGNFAAWCWSPLHADYDSCGLLCMGWFSLKSFGPPNFFLVKTSKLLRTECLHAETFFASARTGRSLKQGRPMSHKSV